MYAGRKQWSKLHVFGNKIRKQWGKSNTMQRDGIVAHLAFEGHLGQLAS